MAIVESGLIVNGMPIISTEYYPAEKEVDPYIKTALFSAIQTFASQALKDEGQEMVLKKFILLTQNLNPDGTEQLVLYTIMERGTDVSEVKRRLKNLQKKIELSPVIFETPTMTRELRKVKRTIDKELKDLCVKPADRLKKLFGT